MNKILLIHPKFDYVPEIEIAMVYNQMIKESNCQMSNFYIKNVNDYKIKRNNLVKLIFSMNAQFHYKTQTAFKAICYMDQILYSNYIPERAYGIIALSSFTLSAKFCENDPLIPTQYKFCDALFKSSKGKYFSSLYDLLKGEVQCLNYLQYKLQRYTLYDYLHFYFVNGFLFDDNKNIQSEKAKLLERIYNKARSIIDYFLIMEGEFVFNNKCYDIAKNVLKVVVEDVLNKKCALVIDKIYKENINENKNQKENIDNIINNKVKDVYEHIKSKKEQMKRVLSDKVIMDNNKSIKENKNVNMNQFRQIKTYDNKENDKKLPFKIKVVKIKKKPQKFEYIPKAKPPITIYSNYRSSISNQSHLYSDINQKENNEYNIYNVMNTISFNSNIRNIYKRNDNLYTSKNSYEFTNFKEQSSIGKNEKNNDVEGSYFSNKKRNLNSDDEFDVFTPKKADILTRTLNIFSDHSRSKEMKRDLSVNKIGPSHRNLPSEMIIGFQFSYNNIGMTEFDNYNNHLNYL